MNIYEFLRSIRGKDSLREAAKKTGLSHGYINILEKGFDPRTKTLINPSPETLKAYAQGYHISYEELMEKAGYTQKPSYLENLLVISNFMESLFGSGAAEDNNFKKDEQLLEFMEQWLSLFVTSYTAGRLDDQPHTKWYIVKSFEEYGYDASELIKSTDYYEAIPTEDRVGIFANMIKLADTSERSRGSEDTNDAIDIIFGGRAPARDIKTVHEELSEFTSQENLSNLAVLANYINSSVGFGHKIEDARTLEDRVEQLKQFAHVWLKGDLNRYLKGEFRDGEDWILEEAFKRYGYDPTKLSNPDAFNEIATYHKVGILAQIFKTSSRYETEVEGEDVMHEDIYRVVVQKAIPLLDKITAGEKLKPISEYHDQIASVDPELLGDNEGFALRVQSDEMNGDRIQFGDVVIVVMQDQVEPDDIAVVAVDQERAKLRRVKREGEMCMLIPSNPSMSPDLVDFKRVSVIGKVVEVKFWPK